MVKYFKLFNSVQAIESIQFNPLQPVIAFFIPPENITKPKGFLMFSGGIEKQHRAVMS